VIEAVMRRKGQPMARRDRKKNDPHPPQQARLDASHESDTRGEHRYDAAHQTSAEQQAREERDELKRRLAGRARR